MRPACLSHECVCLCASESVYGLALSGSHYGTFEYTCPDSNGSGSTQGSKRRWSQAPEEDEQPREGGQKMETETGERGEKEKERQKHRGERMREPEHLASTLPLLFVSAADVVVRKGGAKKKISIKL